jgi:hypothetical protein
MDLYAMHMFFVQSYNYKLKMHDLD